MRNKLIIIFEYFTFILLSLLICGYVLFSKTFSKIAFNLYTLPIYINELFLIIGLIICIVYIINKTPQKFIKLDLLNIGFLIFYILFFISLFRGIFLYGDKNFVLRQSALFYYSLFFFITIFSFNNGLYRKIKILNYIFLISGNIIAIPFLLENINLKILKFLPEGFGANGSYFICLLLFLIIINFLLAKNKIIKSLYCIDLIMLLVVNFFYMMRGVWVATIIALIFLIIGLFIIKIDRKKLLIFNIAFFTTIIFSAIIIFIIINFQSEIHSAVKSEFQSFYNSFNKSTSEVRLAGDIPSINTKWRLITWRDMLLEVKKSPFLGYGFGKKFISKTTLEYGWTTGLEDGWVEAHNYIISFLFRSGLLGLFSFLFIIAAFFKKVFEFIKKHIIEKLKIILICILSGIVYILILGLFEVVLEVPYFGFFLWFLMGLCISIINNENRNNLNNFKNNI